jgi:phenylpropionate dioxygenase-like ring-hydroxylating dioxygenase large terminal subunit
MNANYPLNCWYVAATSDELDGDTLLARRILDVPVLLYRRQDGGVTAMHDRCAHRPHPLSTGHREGDQVACAYHGITYDPDGRCVRVPSQDNVPQGVRVPTFAIHEQAPFVWIWMGSQGGSRLRPPPATPALDDSEWQTLGERLSVDANFLLLHEHYLDLTNVFAMHPEMVPPGIETLPAIDQVEVSEVSVSYQREIPSAPLAPWEAHAAGLDSTASFGRRETGTFVTPGLHQQTYSVVGDDGAMLDLVRTHGFTPATPTSTHVFLQVAWRGERTPPEAAEGLREAFLAMAGRDAEVLEATQRCIEEDGSPGRYVNVKADRAALRARRIVHAMVDEERGRTFA